MSNDTTTPVSFGTHLRQERKAAGFTMGDLAQVTGKTVAEISKIELDHLEATAAFVEAAAKALSSTELTKTAKVSPTTGELVAPTPAAAEALEDFNLSYITDKPITPGGCHTFEVGSVTPSRSGGVVRLTPTGRTPSAPEWQHLPMPKTKEGARLRAALNLGCEPLDLNIGGDYTTAELLGHLGGPHRNTIQEAACLLQAEDERWFPARIRGERIILEQCTERLEDRTQVFVGNPTPIHAGHLLNADVAYRAAKVNLEAYETSHRRAKSVIESKAAAEKVLREEARQHNLAGVEAHQAIAELLGSKAGR